MATRDFSLVRIDLARTIIKLKKADRRVKGVRSRGTNKRRRKKVVSTDQG